MGSGRGQVGGCPGGLTSSRHASEPQATSLREVCFQGAQPGKQWGVGHCLVPPSPQFPSQQAQLLTPPP